MATVKDIADEVGISKAAVSRILNHKGSFSQETILKVERAARRLNYVSRADAAESADDGKTLAAIFPVAGMYFSNLTSLLEKACYDYGYSLMLCSSAYNDLDTAAFIELLRKKHIAGILFGSSTYNLALFQDASLPAVAIGHAFSDTIPYIHSDNLTAGRIAAKHLLGKGVKEFLYLSNYPDGLQADERYLGYCEELEKAGKTPWPYIVESSSSEKKTDPSEVITQMIMKHPDADGLFVESQSIAMEAVHVYQNLGYTIPAQIKIVGYGSSALNRYTMPKLTIIRENTEQIAVSAVSTMADLLEKGRAKEADLAIPVSVEQNQTS